MEGDEPKTVKFNKSYTKHIEDKRNRMIDAINIICNELDVDPWELDCWDKHECERCEC